MKGMELAKAYWEEYGWPMIRDQFPEYTEIIAAGLTGSGSECFGFDDEVSQDHDFEPDWMSEAPSSCGSAGTKSSRAGHPASCTLNGHESPWRSASG